MPPAFAKSTDDPGEGTYIGRDGTSYKGQGADKNKAEFLDLIQNIVGTEGPYFGVTQEDVQEAAMEALYDLLTGKGDYGIRDLTCF